MSNWRRLAWPVYSHSTQHISESPTGSWMEGWCTHVFCFAFFCCFFLLFFKGGRLPRPARRKKCSPKKTDKQSNQTRQRVENCKKKEERTLVFKGIRFFRRPSSTSLGGGLGDRLGRPTAGLELVEQGQVLFFGRPPALPKARLDEAHQAAVDDELFGQQDQHHLAGHDQWNQLETK